VADASNKEAPRVLNPLWIISLFLGLSEVTVGLAATQVDGWLQATLAIFSIAFPLSVAAAFFYTLWQRPGILYAPRDYGGETTVRDYVTELSNYTRRSIDVVENAIRSSANAAGSPIGELKIDPSKRREIVESLVSAVRGTVLTIDLSEFDGDRSSIDVPIGESTTVAQLLDGIWFAISKHVPAFSYGERWILWDRINDRPLRDMGTTYAQRYLHKRRDDRSLRDVGISPSSKLSAVVYP
jgi:hypothetical protein